MKVYFIAGYAETTTVKSAECRYLGNKEYETTHDSDFIAAGEIFEVDDVRVSLDRSVVTRTAIKQLTRQCNSFLDALKGMRERIKELKND